MAHQYPSKPWGDIYQVDQSPTNAFAARLYREQQQREMQKRMDTKMLDDEFGKNVAGVKSADIPELTQAYNDFKQQHINLQKKKAATPQDQMDLLLKKQKVYEIINSSKEDKERLKAYGTALKSDTKRKFDPAAPQMINTWLNTPTSKRNLDDDVNLKYKYAIPNIDKEIANAAGRGEEVEVNVGVDEKDPLKDRVQVYKKMNNPNAFYDNLFTGLGSRSDHDGFTMGVMDNVTDQELEDLRTRYETKIASPEFKAIYGETKPFPASAGNTDLGKAVAIKTMQVVDNLPITPVKEKYIDNKTAIANRKAAEEAARDKRNFGQDLYKQGLGFKQQEKMEGIRQANRKALKDYSGGKDKQNDEMVLNTFVNNQYENGSDEIPGVTIGDKTYKGRVVQVPKDVKDKYILDKGNTTEQIPDKWYMTEDKKFIIPLFIDKKDGKPILRKSGAYNLKANHNSEPINIQNYKIDLGKLLVTQKARGGEVIDQFDDEETATPTAPTKPPVKKDPLGLFK